MTLKNAIVVAAVCVSKFFANMFTTSTVEMIIYQFQKLRRQKLLLV